MRKASKAPDFGLTIGELPPGPLDSIADVPGIRVGHATIDSGDTHTGVTVILPSVGNIFINKLEAAAWVLNGFGKSAGLVQIEELGTLESPIALTNTLNVWRVGDALVEYMLERCAREGLAVESFNPVIGECNDSWLNHIARRAVGRDEVFAAIESAKADFDEGAVGAGRGMSCHQLKGGIGSASRRLRIDERSYTVGVLVLSNHGRLADLLLDGRKVGQAILESRQSREKGENREKGTALALQPSADAPAPLPDRQDLAGTAPAGVAETDAGMAADKGSIISIIATDLPLSSRQLGRLCKRASVGLARLGSRIGHGSGEIMIAFSTALVTQHGQTRAFHDLRLLDESRIDEVFRAVAECEEESVLNSMLSAQRLEGFRGHVSESLRDYEPLWRPGP